MKKPVFQMQYFKNEGNTVIAPEGIFNAICVFIFIIYELAHILKCSEVCIAE